MKWFLFLAFLGLSFQALSYTSPFYMIYKKTAQKHGSGMYRIKSQTLFPYGAGKISLSEEWIVKDEKNMLLTVRGSFQGEPIEAQILYTSRGKLFISESSKKITKKSQIGYAEPFFHFRKKSNFHRVLASLSLIPPSATLTPPAPRDIESITYTKDRFLKLSRLQGKVSYFTSRNKDKAGLWIEQDQFVIQKIKLDHLGDHSKTIEALHYTRYPRGLYFPRKRKIFWKNKEIQIELTSVKAISNKEKTKLKTSSLKKPNRWAFLNDLKSFYIYER